MESERRTIRVLTELSQFNLEEFDDRLRFQKLVFIAKKMGHNLGYTFNWYARGPYSPSLTRVVFNAQDQNAFTRDTSDLNVSESRIIDDLREFLGDEIENPKSLELIASVWYFLKDRTYTAAERDRIIEIIIQKKPHFTYDEVREVFDRIQKN